MALEDPRDDLAELRETFSLFDTDGNGSISMIELAEVIEKISSVRPNMEELKRMFEVVDVNNDGKIGK